MYGTKIAIEKFLNTALPSEIILPEGDPKFYVAEDIENLILERKPFFWVTKAVSIGLDFMLTNTRVTAKQCEGHFPDDPTVPLIEIFRLAAQTGLLLTAVNVARDQQPLAGGSGKNRAKTEIPIKAPVNILVEARKTGFKMGLYLIDTRIFAFDFQVATAESIVYTVVPKSDILKQPQSRP